MVGTIGGAEKPVEETPEFYVPAQGLGLRPYLRDGDIAGIHHLGRYYWACQVLAHLRPAAAGRDNLRYDVVGNMVTWRYRETDEPIGRYDCIVSFDTIEHLLASRGRDAVDRAQPGRGWRLPVLDPLRARGRHAEPGLGTSQYRIFLSDAGAAAEILLPLGGDGRRSRFIAGTFWTDVINRDFLRYPTIGNPLICRGPIRYG